MQWTVNLILFALETIQLILTHVTKGIGPFLVKLC